MQQKIKTAIESNSIHKGKPNMVLLDEIDGVANGDQVHFHRVLHLFTIARVWLSGSPGSALTKRSSRPNL